MTDQSYEPRERGEEDLDLTADPPSSQPPLGTPYQQLSAPIRREQLRGRVFYISLTALILYIAATFLVVVADWATAETMQRLASYLLPPLTALTASAAAFYYTHPEDR